MSQQVLETLASQSVRKRRKSHACHTLFLMERSRCLLAVTFIACATAPHVHPVRAQASIAAGFESTWSALVDLFSDRNWAIEHIDKDSGLITTDWMELGKGAATYADCGTAPLADIPSTQVRFNVRVRADGDSTWVTVNASFRQLRVLDDARAMVDCNSTGEVEQLIHRGITSRLRPPSRSAPPGTATTPQPRGFYCTSSPVESTAGFCDREKETCARLRDSLVLQMGDLTQCALVESAFCFVDHCAPTMEACAAQRSRAGSDSEPDCLETR